jgi:Holin of 3TMs, for gene-transfer release
MNPLLLGPILEVGRTLLDRFIPDPAAKREAEMELIRMTAEGELKQTIAQLEINAREATHTSVFVAGWRPAFGWCGAAGFLYATIGQPLLAWVGAIRGWPAPPELNLDLLWVVVTGLLGIGGLRTVEKLKAVTK